MTDTLHPALAQAIAPILSRRTNRAPRVGDIVVSIQSGIVSFVHVLTISRDADGNSFVNLIPDEGDITAIYPTLRENLLAAFTEESIEGAVMGSALRRLRRNGGRITSESAGREAVFFHPSGTLVVDLIHRVESSHSHPSPRGFRSEEDGYVAVCTI